MVERFAKLQPSETASPGETLELGARLGKQLRAGAVVALYGEFGAGKTHLAKGLCSGLGVPPDEVTSPTFTIVHEYQGRLPVYHVDAYRIKRVEELYELGYDSFFFGDGVTVVEWADRIEPLIPLEALRLRLRHAGGDRRLIEVVEV